MEDVVEDRGRDWFVGVDWASQTHHVFLIDAQGRKLGERGFTHGGEGLAEMAAWIEKQTGAAPGEAREPARPRNRKGPGASRRAPS